MGLGDEIMALGEAERYFERTGNPCRIVNAMNVDRHMDIWEGNPAYDRNSKYSIKNGSSARPYILGFGNQKISFNYDYKARAGKIYLTKEQEDYCQEKNFCIVQPNLKNGASKNKDWGFDKWQEVCNALEYDIVQIYQDGDILLEGVRHVKTKTVFHALSWIKKADFVLCNEGGTNHMAASVGTMAFAYFGGFTPPEVLGYDEHCNIAANCEPCGDWHLCKDCTKAKQDITPAHFLCYINKYIGGEDVKGIYRI